MIKKTVLGITLLTSIILATSCEKEETPITYDCTGLTPTYTANVKPIMDTYCAVSGCHDAASQEGGHNFSTYAILIDHATENEFMGSMQHLNGYDAMPKDGAKLSDSQLQTISCWIANGMPE